MTRTCLATLLALAAAGCSSSDPATAPDMALGPHEAGLILTEADRDTILGRVDREPYGTMLDVIRVRATPTYEEPDPMFWDHSTIGHNNTAAQANAFLAWLEGDDEAAQKAKDFLLAMPTDFETNDTWDVNIRMPHVLMTACYAWDFLRAAGALSADESAEIERRITEVNGKFFEEYILVEFTRQAVLGYAQNNHPIRTAAAIGTVAITFPNHPDASEWANWAVSEMDYLMGPDGQYLQPDGGVSEGPFYYGFAYGPAIAFAISIKNVAADRTFERDCRNRQNIDPWTDHGCVSGEAFTYDNPLDGELLQKTVDWSINLRLPIGWRAPLADGNFIHHNGGPLLTSFGGEAHHLWDWDTMPEEPMRAMTWGMDLSVHHLAYVDDAVGSSEPPWRNGFFPDAGNVAFRSGWGEDDRWLLLVGESGAARKTLHDHVDGTSFTLAAYGEYLLLDPGYHKPNAADNAVTADGNAHNVILIDGQGAPNKGLLFDFGDTDASIENFVDGEALAFAEAMQSYEQTSFERGIAFVRQRYFVVADRLTSEVTTPREHRWRLGGWAGLEIPGTFEVHDCSGLRCGASWEREKAGVEVFLGSTAPGLTVIEPERTPGQAPHVGAFDRERNVKDHGVIDGLVTATAPGYLAVLAPYQVGGTGDDSPLTVTPLDVGDAPMVAYTVEGDGGREVVWLRGAGAPTSLTVDGMDLESDGELVVASLDDGFALVARGSGASLDGTPLVETNGAPVAIVDEAVE